MVHARKISRPEVNRFMRRGVSPGYGERDPYNGANRRRVFQYEQKDGNKGGKEMHERDAKTRRTLQKDRHPSRTKLAVYVT